MASVVIDKSALSARISYSVSGDVATNKSTVRITGIELKSNWEEFGNVYVEGYVDVGGVRAATLTLTSLGGYGLVLGSSFSGGNLQSASLADVKLSHASDGTCTGVKVTVSLSLRGDNGRSCSGSALIDLPRIPRVSAITASGVSLGTAMTITINRALSSFTDTVTWECGTASGTVASKTGSKTLSWTPPLTLAAQAVRGTSVKITLTCTTYSGSTNVGSGSVTVTCSIPASVVPTVSAVLSDQQGLTGSYGGYVQNQSRLRVQTTAAGVYGSTISSVSVTCAGSTQTGTNAVFALASSGSVSVTVKVTDSRGRSAKWTGSVTVLAYSRPTIRIVDASRADSSGELNPAGTSALIRFTGAITSLDGKNTARYYLRKRLRGTDSWSRTEITAAAGQFTPTKESCMTSGAADSAYEFSVRAEDSFGYTDSAVVTLPVAFALLDFDKTNKAVGILQRAGTANVVSIGGNTKHFGHRITDVAAPTAAADAATKAYVDGQAGKLLLSAYSAETNTGTVSVPPSAWTNLLSLETEKGYLYDVDFCVRYPTNSTGSRRLLVGSSRGSGTPMDGLLSATVGTSNVLSFVHVRVRRKGNGGTWYMNTYQNSGAALDAIGYLSYTKVPLV